MWLAAQRTSIRCLEAHFSSSQKSQESNFLVDFYSSSFVSFGFGSGLFLRTLISQLQNDINHTTATVAPAKQGKAERKLSKSKLRLIYSVSVNDYVICGFVNNNNRTKAAATAAKKKE